MSDVLKAQSTKSDLEISSKRSIKLTEKGLMSYIKMCQDKRNAKLKQARRIMDDLNVLMESNDKADSVNSLLATFIQCSQDAEASHKTLTSLPLPYDELMKQNEHFQNKMSSYHEFTELVRGWLCEREKPFVQPSADDYDQGKNDVDNAINPEDSASNVRSVKSKSGSQVSRVSSTSSARIKAEAERAALLERAAGLKKKHQLEAQEEKLKQEKEQLELETELAAANAKLRVLEINSQCGSKCSDGMNSYIEKRNSNLALDPCAKVFVPERNMDDFKMASAIAEKPVVRLKQKPPIQSVDKPQSVCDELTVQQISIIDIMQRQNDITAMLVQQNQNSVLPPRNIPVFDGDPLQYGSFIRAFENSVEAKTSNLSDCLHFLEQYTRGQPRDLVHSCQHLPSELGYPRAKSLLSEHFGNEYKIAQAYMDKINNWPAIKNEDIKSLQAFSLFLKGCSNLTEYVTHLKELDLPSNMRSIILKLPYKMRESWRNVACDLQEHRGQRALFIDLVVFIEKQVKVVSDPLFGNIIDLQQLNSKNTHSSFTKQKKRGNSFATNVLAVKNEDPSENKNKSSKGYSCLYCLLSNHTIDKCFKFKDKSHKDKVNFIKEKGMCFGCLKVGHISRECRGRFVCSVCHQQHPSVLHIDKESTEVFSRHLQNPPSTTSTMTQTCGHVRVCDEDNSNLSIVAVQVRSPKTNITVQTYAFLDPGSTGTFCTESLAWKLQLKGKRTSIQLQTMGHKDIQNVPQQEDIDKWPYLQSIKLHDIDADVDLLIGTDAPKVMEPWELINSQEEGPYAVWTRVGWVINGPLRSERNKTGYHAFTVNKISVKHLETMLIEQYNHDFNEKTSQEQIEMSREDIKFMNIMNNSAQLKNGHYCVDLPFKSESSVLPINRCVAEQRLLSLKRKFNMNSTFKKDYIAFMNDMLCNGYAEIVPDDQLMGNEGKVWYIPHHGVYHPRKGKLRVVFDCAATFKGTSLNCQLLQGPDLTNSVVGVLLRFRQEPIAVMADIQAMFHQVHVPEKHRDCLRFLWWPNGDTSQVPQEYRMTVHLFGAVSSPSCANYALRRTAEDNSQQFPAEVVSTIKHNFYVDDCLKSLPTEEEAIKFVQDLTSLCNKGGFKLSKWLSNSPAVLQMVSGNTKAKEMLEMDLELPMERALGLQWCIQSDSFKFKASLPERSRTRRGILSVVSSLYDPLGFLAPFIITAKFLLQELCRRNLGWDDAVHHHFSKQWTDWLDDLKRISKFEERPELLPSSRQPSLDWSSLQPSLLYDWTNCFIENCIFSVKM
ncbi:uncharacterized protein LOC116718567 isoform X3 [Xiphophorus hellerii]|uniref:uncharacterized protein LOC116718567 isoform X3 n=1 Tax=Xiphophorus hellerii TaxID=8084 RepID=UPI0013B41929|nr:uncharacterized protein LOC116718567 isoform X3 [Xiphophorus hellerii]